MDTRLVLVTGLHRDATSWVAGRLLRAEPGTVVVHHDLSTLAEGIVRRRVRFFGGPTGAENGSSEGTERLEGAELSADMVAGVGGEGGSVWRDSTAVLELAHGCVSCTLREDTLPLLRKLVARSDVRRVVLHLDPGMEPEPVCWALHNVLVGDVVIADLVTIEAVVAVVDDGEWLAAATGDEPLGLTPDDDRTLAQVAVGQVEFADAVVVTGQGDRWEAARTAAVLDRLVPGAPRAATVHGLLEAIPATATLRDALLTDDELARDWRGYEDPFMAREPLEDKA